tara:strand:- start:1704 stop:1919 length:216 start_codon:yes stop_codon:yes gene_type:complete
MKKQIDFELGLGIDAALVYYITEYPEGTYIEVDSVYYQSGKEKHDMSFLLEDKTFHEHLHEIACEDAYEIK